FLPAPGSVLRWTSGATHSAVVTGVDSIAGYNQGQQFVGAGMGRTVRRSADVHPAHTAVSIILETTIVNAAGVVFNLCSSVRASAGTERPRPPRAELARHREQERHRDHPD